MRLSSKNSGRALVALTLGLAAASCSVVGDSPSSAASAEPADRFGPAADYPLVVGAPYTVEGTLYTPQDTMNYDEVGYAGLVANAGSGVTASHRTLPLPSYVEVTSLDSGKTALVRLESRGPKTGTRLVGLSPDAIQQLGISEGAAIRVRRVNPPEADRAKLRMSERAPERMETPASLLTVLKRKLPERGSAPLMPAGPAPAMAPVAASTAAVEQVSAISRPQLPIAASAISKYDLPAMGGKAATSRPAPVTRPVPPRGAVTPKPATAPSSTGNFVVQAAAFSSRANADRAAKSLGGFVVQAGKFFRVRTGPFDSRGEAQAALAKVRAAGYSDAKVSTKD